MLAAALALIAAIAAALARSGRLAEAVTALERSGRLPVRIPGRPQPGDADWRCQCGQRYRVSGMDRHRIYWPAGAREEEPVLAGECANCGRPLPA